MALLPSRTRRWLLVGLLPLMLLLTGCTATGMGWIPSALDPTDKATFGFSFDVSSNGTTSALSGSYHDPQGQTAAGVADVAFKGTGQLHKCTATDPLCVSAPPSKGQCLAGHPAYESQNSGLPGSGTFVLFVCDSDGNGIATGDGLDLIQIDVDSGPYTGYHNEGNPQGNITVKS